MSPSVYLKAFSMIEMAVVLAIMSIVTLIAIPNYQQIVKKFQYLEVVHEMVPWRIQVEMCYWQTGGFDTCRMGQSGIGVFRSGRAISELDIDQGHIHITPHALRGIKPSETLIVKPNIIDDRIEWSYDGVAVEHGYV